ncbi:MAG: alpha/beta fold hydrolase [Candidatus Schmidhempelia sp.]|nr:alpha/beta fold hydrolase [Candidatus Schmidhempelia sp.]
MQLNYQIEGEGDPIILLHGLFGSLSNLGVLTRHLRNHYQTIAVDLRNHGLSPWSADMNYQLMANDINDLIHKLKLQQVTVIGHSMGGKTSMQLVSRFPKAIKQVIVLDIAPINYPLDFHKDVFMALNASIKSGMTDNKQIMSIMQHYITQPVAQFLLKSFKHGSWLFNYTAIQKNYTYLADWQTIETCVKPIYFLKGSRSHYIKPLDHKNILAQFPLAKIFTIEGSGHNVHVEQPQQVLTIIDNILSSATA